MSKNREGTPEVAQSGRMRWMRGVLAALLALALFALPACDLMPTSEATSQGAEQTLSAEQTPLGADAIHQPDTLEFISMLDENPDLKALFEKAIAKGVEINPDRVTNPAQNLEEYYSFLDWSTLCMPWNIMYNKEHPTLMDSIDQSLNYFYFILDIPLEELEGQGLYYNSLEYEPRVSAWMNEYTENWGNYLSTKESWNDQYYWRAYADAEYGLQKGWYEPKENWHSFNDFFARHLIDPSARPIAAPDDDSVVASPADSVTQGVWQVDENSNILNADRQQDGPDSEVVIKSKGFNSVPQLLMGSKYAEDFANGTLTHTFLNVQDYHRYHFPVSGEVVEMGHIPAAVNIGGLTAWDPAAQKYQLYSEQPTWESIETRAYVIVKTEQYGLVACMPVGMSQVSSVNFTEGLEVGDTVKKGDELGYFLFGGSDFVLIFQKDVQFDLTVPQDEGGYVHVLMGEEYGRLSVR
ncbi:MAG: phosphatidylserine decarboxylase [Coriobacteriales bacterium]|jgi:phosphatidylserine decarboxylase precursor|nr:phosphatidylserine decarboxylase [Coriobacteriales bacterium]